MFVQLAIAKCQICVALAVHKSKSAEMQSKTTLALSWRVTWTA